MMSQSSDDIKPQQKLLTTESDDIKTVLVTSAPDEGTSVPLPRPIANDSITTTIERSSSWFNYLWWVVD
jgi:hypothetical protein